MNINDKLKIFGKIYAGWGISHEFYNNNIYKTLG